MRENGKKRINLLDVVIVLVVIAAVAAFFLRGRIQALFKEEANNIITYSYVVTDVEEDTAAFLQAGETLFDESGKELGEVLSAVCSDATDAELLPDGRAVEVKNGKTEISGAVSAKGYEANGFVYLEGGILLIPGGTLTVYTVDAVFTLQITDVQVASAQGS